MKQQAKYSLLLMLAFFCTAILSACDQPNSANFNNDSAATFPIDRIFRDYYRSLGGADILGVPIIESFEWNELTCQYTEKVLMCFNPAADSGHRYNLSPLGAYLNISNLIESRQSTDPIEVYKEFQPLYKKLQGENNVGRALTPVRFNPLEQRLEQFFDNVGFYRLVEDPEGTAHLLAYGVFVCQDKCSYPARKGSAIAKVPISVDMPFMDAIARMDNPAAFGEPLTVPFQLENGQIQQIYQNAVFIGNSMQVETVRLLNVPILLGYEVSEPKPQDSTTKAGLVFYNVSGANGFNVPVIFDQFIVGHGGREFSGDPIGEFFEKGDQYRQCFQNYCLDYAPSAASGKKVEMVALGEEYLAVSNLPESYVVRFRLTSATVTIQTSARYEPMPIENNQEIEIYIQRNQDAQPVADVDFTLMLTFPDGTQQQYISQPTNLLGKTIISLPLFPTLKRGRVIAYQVCLNQASDREVCTLDHYLVW